MTRSISTEDYRRSNKARAAREKGKALGNYTREVTRELAKPRQPRHRTPSKRG